MRTLCRLYPSILTAFVLLAACGGGGGGGAGSSAFGSIEVVTNSQATVGDGSLDVEIDGGHAGNVPTAGTLVLQGIAAGSHQVRLTGLRAECSVTGGPVRQVAVAAGALLRVEFSITCPRPRLAYRLGSNGFAFGMISRFRVDPATGGLALLGHDAVAGSELQALAVHPQAPFLYVAAGPASLPPQPGAVKSFRIDLDTGALTQVGADAAIGSLPKRLTITPDGALLFAATSPNSVTRLRIDPLSGVATTLGTTPIAGGQGGFDLAVDPSGRFLIASTIGFTGVVASFRIGAGGDLTAVNSVTGFLGATELAMHPLGTFAFVGVGDSSNGLQTLLIDTISGALTAFSQGVESSFSEISPGGGFLHRGFGNELRTFSIGPGGVSGITLGPAGTTPLPVSTSGYQLVFDPIGAFAYVSSSPQTFDDGSIVVMRAQGSGAFSEVRRQTDLGGFLVFKDLAFTGNYP